VRFVGLINEYYGVLCSIARSLVTGRMKMWCSDVSVCT